MNNENIYQQFKQQIDKCAQSIENKIFKPLGIKPLGMDLRVTKRDTGYTMDLIHYLTTKDRDRLGDMNWSGELDDYSDQLYSGFTYNINPNSYEGLYCDGPCIDGYVYPSGVVFNQNTKPAIQFYWGWLPSQLVEG